MISVIPPPPTENMKNQNFFVKSIFSIKTLKQKSAYYFTESIICYECRSDRTNICENLDNPRLVSRIPQPECNHLQAFPTFACIKTVQYSKSSCV